MTGRRWFWVAVVAAVAMSVPLLGVIPPSLFFRRDDFAWLAWAAEHRPWDAFRPGLAETTPGGRFRPIHALFWIFGYDVFGTGSAVPWILLSSAFFAAALVLMLLWGDERDQEHRLAGKASVAIWFAAFLPVTFFVLNIYNNGKTITLFFLPLAIRYSLAAVEGRGRKAAWIGAVAALLAFLTRESAFVIFPATVATYVLADHRERSCIRGRSLLTAFLAVVLLGAAVIFLSSFVREMIARAAGGGFPEGARGNLEYFLSLTFFAGYRRFFWIGLVLLLSFRRKFFLAGAPVAGNGYARNRSGYRRRFRLFYVWRQTPYCFFGGFGRPDVRLIEWENEPPPGDRPAFFFASNVYEKELFEEGPAAYADRLLFENRSCSVHAFPGDGRTTPVHSSGAARASD